MVVELLPSTSVGKAVVAQKNRKRKKLCGRENVLKTYTMSHSDTVYKVEIFYFFLLRSTSRHYLSVGVG